MAVHTIMPPDQMWGREPRSVIWDDEAGTVSGGHSDVPWVQEVLAKPTPVNFSDEGRKLFLLDPAHDPADFWHLLLVAFWPSAQVQGMGGGDTGSPTSAARCASGARWTRRRAGRNRSGPDEHGPVRPPQHDV